MIRTNKIASATAFSFADLENNAERMVEQARAQAAEIVRAGEREARAAAERIAERARQEGSAEGRREGLEQARREAAQAALQEAREELDRLSESLRTALDGFDQNKRALIVAAETGLIGLALAIARRVCKVQAARSSQVALENTRHLLELVRHDQDLVVRINPAEHHAIQTAVAKLLTDTERLEHVAVVPDESVERGGCTLASKDTTIDATLDMQLDRIAAALLPEAGEPETAA